MNSDSTLRNRDFAPPGEAITGALRNVLNCDCEFCKAHPIVPELATRILEAWGRQMRSGGEITPYHVHALRILARATSPILGEQFENILDVDVRTRKEIMRELRDLWLLPVCATRQKPFGYFIAKTAAEFEPWMDTTLSQAISELAVAYKVYRVNFAELAGQRRLAIVNEVEKELAA